MTRNDKIQLYCSLFEKIYGEQPIADMSSISDDELREATEQLKGLYRIAYPND